MKKPKLRELKEAIEVIFSRPFTTKFPFAPSIPPSSFRGKPEYVEEKCIGCTACYEVCPAGAIRFTDNGGIRRIERHYDECIFCSECAVHCSTGEGIRITTEYDLAVLDRSEAVESVEKQLAYCDICGGVVSTIDHLKWLFGRLGDLAFAHPGISMKAMEDFGVIEAERKEKELIKREDRFRFLCPECRRKTILREEWS